SSWHHEDLYPQAGVLQGSTKEGWWHCRWSPGRDVVTSQNFPNPYDTLLALYDQTPNPEPQTLP
ncbi:hypothetical protein BS17DRAFT_776534, partial [Gyrodon lividus]